MMAKYIIFTDNNDCCFPPYGVENPFSLMGLSTFGDESIAMIGRESKCVINSPTDVEVCSDWDILVHIDGTDFHEGIFRKFIEGEEIYVLLHKGVDNGARKNDQIKFIKEIMGDSFKNIIEHSHDSKSIYWNELIELAECVSNGSVCGYTYSNILQKLQSRWPNPYLESFIHLYKDIGLVQLKINKNILTLEQGADAVKLVQKSEKTKLAADKMKKNEVENNINELSDYLTLVEKEIVTLSAKK